MYKQNPFIPLLKRLARSRACPVHPQTPYRPRFASHSPFPRRQTTASVFKPLNILAAAIPVTTFFLGVWQVKRLNWKLGLIDEVQRNLEREPMVLPDVIDLAALPNFAFRRVLLQGHYSAPYILLGPVVKDGVPGFNLILPFHRSPHSSTSPTSTPSSSPFLSSKLLPSTPTTTPTSSSPTPTQPTTILLNLGFLTSTRAKLIQSGAIPPPGIGDGEVIVEGMLSKRFSEGKPSSWQPDNVPEKGEWFWKDVESMAEFVGGTEKGVQPVLVEALDYGDQPTTLLMQEGIPVGTPPIIEIRNQHATYAVTWFSLSAATTVMLWYLAKRGKPVRHLRHRSTRI